MREKILKESIRIDHDRYYDMYDCPHFRFPIEDFRTVNEIADGIRSDIGNVPFFDFKNVYDDEGWYDFFVDCDYEEGNLTNIELSFRVENASLSDDSQEHYKIDITDDEKEAIAEVVWDEMNDYIKTAIEIMEE